MPSVVMRPKNNEMVLVREVRDSAGRTDQQVRAMEQNDPEPPHISATDRLYAEQIAMENAVWPKVMYHLAVKWPKKDGKPDTTAEPILNGDRINPNYPMPYALALENGFQGQITGHGTDKAVNVVHPYKTCFVPIGWDPLFPMAIDEKECAAQVVKLEKEGWVDHPSKLKGLPEKAAEVD
jgi:hypothetical protein